MTKRILIAEDEHVLRSSLAELLVDEGHEVFQAADGQEAHDLLLRQPVDLLLSDLFMPRLDGLGLLRALRLLAPQTPAIIMTAFSTVESALTAMKTGAVDYLIKPVHFDDLLMRIKRALDVEDLKLSQQVVAEQLAAPTTFHNLIGDSPQMGQLFEQVHRLSQVKSSVLLVGESGTGKELFARAIHYNGLTREKPFIAINAGAIPESLLESELFGHRRGSFTGAHRDRVGYFEAAHGGTLFLDEISSLPLTVQASLLRVLEERTVIPVGDTQPRQVDLRIIAASNRDLLAMVEAEEFRRDLYYRLAVVTLELPALRLRRQDIPLLAYHFLEKYCREMNKPMLGVTNGAMRALLSYSWPGNIRELENIIERAVIFCNGPDLSVADLRIAEPGAHDEVGGDLEQALAQFERQHILSGLRKYKYDKIAAAKYLGIARSSIYRKLDELNLPKSEEEDREQRWAPPITGTPG